MIDAKPLDVADGIRRRRMHRTFTDRPVPREVLGRMAWAAARAQQARSGVRHVVVADDPALLATARQVLPGFLNNAPAMLVLCTDLGEAGTSGGPRLAEHVSRLDSGAACAHLALMAQTLGLGVCTVTSWADEAVRALLGLPGHIRPDVTVAVGYVTKETASPAARGFTSGLHHNAFGAAFADGAR
ncbi:nitroreductase family protein [Nonomuraea typhae]|uniref:nitroreductase family protein n=1 Tax=Nonomuraea typhae TaxID=2603600 RepID=UPI0015E24384|nr:nitroreductase family protein [Nonomuraea typhae]